LPIITLASTPNTICNGTPDGTASLTSLTYQGNPVASPFTGYTFLWSTTATTSSIGTLPKATYSLAVTKTDVGCTSDLVFVNVDENFFIPPIDVAIVNQTSCNTTAPNGTLTGTINETTIGGGAAVNSGYDIDWFNGVGIGGTSVTTTTAINGQVNQLPGNLNYTVSVTRITTGCTNTETVFLPEVITYPIVVAAVSSDVSRCDLPNGSIQANVGGLETGYTFFWLNEEDQNQTTDANVVIANADATIVNDGDYLNLIPGYYTVAVRDELRFAACNRRSRRCVCKNRDQHHTRTCFPFDLWCCRRTNVSNRNRWCGSLQPDVAQRRTYQHRYRLLYKSAAVYSAK
jgi:hypothetical protein